MKVTHTDLVLLDLVLRPSVFMLLVQEDGLKDMVLQWLGLDVSLV